MGGSFETLRWYPRPEHFCWTESFSLIFQEKGKRFGTSYVSAADRYFLEARKTIGSGNGTRLWKLQGMIMYQGTPRSEGLGGKYDIESRGSAVPARVAGVTRATH